ncbi:MAG: ABC transporter ATP-binding protein [Clostridia bacterium]
MNLILKYLRPYKKSVIILVTLLVVSTICELALPTLMSEIVNSGINLGNMSIVYQYSIYMLIFGVIGVLTTILAIKLSSNMSANFAKDLRLGVYEKANTLNFEQFNKIGTGALLTRTTEDVFMLQMFITQALRVIVSVPILILGGSFLAFSKDVTLSLILFAFAPVVLLLVYFVGKNVIPLFEKSDSYIDKQNSIMRERLNGIRVIRAFNKEEHEHNRAKNATETMAGYIINANVRVGLVQPISMFLLNVAVCLIAYQGAVRIQVSNIGAGDIIAVIQYAALVSNGIIVFSFGLIYLPKIKVTLGRLNDVFGVKTIVEVENQKRTFNGDIKFSDVEFKYDGAEEPTLTKVSFEVKNGETLAIVGGTGAGKSTVLQLLLKFYSPSGGKITLDGIDYKEITQNEIRYAYSCVLQKTAIFSGSIRENVLMGKKNANDEEVINALSIAQMSDFLAEKTDGLDFQLEEGGSNLSGGQKQRIAIAGVLAIKPKVLVLDESTAMLDPKGRKEVFEVIKKLNRTEKMTVILITHYMDEAALFDRVIVFDDGHLAFDGTPREVFKNDKELDKIGLKLPRATKLNKHFKECGIDLGEALSTEELLEKIWQYK